MGSTDITELLIDWAGGNRSARDKLFAILHAELRRLASSHMRRERYDHTLGATGLVHEAFLRLADQKRVRWESRSHFFAVASRMMRRILVDYARRRRARKRDGGNLEPFTRAFPGTPDLPVDLLALDEALRRLAKLDARLSQLVELRFFGELTVDETAEALGISPATVKREWTMARAWLRRELVRASPEISSPPT